MKTTLLNFKMHISILQLILFVLFANVELIAQEKNPSELTNFKLELTTTGNDVKIRSTEGSAWIDLAFSTNKDQPQAINEYGMTTLDQASEKHETNRPNYLFTVTKIKNEIVLAGIKGTAWTNLSFSLKNNQIVALNQFGMTKLN
jgi:hypothetical protein